MEAPGESSADARVREEDVARVAASPTADKAQEPSATETATEKDKEKNKEKEHVAAETKTETDRESLGSSSSVRGQEGASSPSAAVAAEPTAGSDSAGEKNEATCSNPAGARGKKPVDAAKKTPAAKMPSKAKAVSARRTVDVVRGKRQPERGSSKAAPRVSKTLSFSAVKVRGERSTTLGALEKKVEKPSREGFHYTPYSGPLPPFSNSLFAPKEVQALERLQHAEARPKAAAPTPKKPFLIKSTGKAGGVVGRGARGAGKENAHVNTPIGGADKSRRLPVDGAEKKPKVARTRKSVKSQSTRVAQAKVRMDRRATISSAAKARATQARLAARQSTPGPARARPAASKPAVVG